MIKRCSQQRAGLLALLICGGSAAAGLVEGQEVVGATCSLSPRPAAIIGTGASTSFGIVQAAAFTADTILVVGDRMNGDLGVFTIQGQRVAKYGGKGRGPGEFQTIQAVSTLHDTIVVYDRALRRVSLFSSRGGFVRSFDSNESLLQYWGEGTFVTVSTRAFTPSNEGASLWADTMSVHVHWNGRSGEVERIAGEIRVIEVRPGLSILPAPYTPEPSIAANTEQIVAADARGVIRRYGLDGVSLGAAQSPFKPAPLTRQGFDKWVAHSVESVPAARRPQRRRLLSAATAPSSTPAHGPVRLDRNSTVWIQEYRAPFDARPARIAALDRQNRLLVQGLASGELIAASPGAAAFRVKDEYDVQAVAIHLVECSSSTSS